LLISPCFSLGKTSTIAFVVRLLLAKGKRVLISSYTHGAVDNVLLKLIEKGLANPSPANCSSNLIRVGLKNSCNPGVLPYLASNVAMSLEAQSAGKGAYLHNQPSAETLKKVVAAAKVVGVTTLTVPRSPLLQKEHFDVVIVDEAGQITQPAVLGSLMHADSFVLVGDHMQLPPLVISDAALNGGKSTVAHRALYRSHCLCCH
jgi:DNA replication ATP-dependent helicase Dna2